MNNGTVFSDSPTGEISIDTLMEAAEVISKSLGLRSLGDKIMADLATSWQYIVSGMFISMLVCLLWIVSMRWTAGFLVWTSMLGTSESSFAKNLISQIQNYMIIKHST